MQGRGAVRTIFMVGWRSSGRGGSRTKSGRSTMPCCGSCTHQRSSSCHTPPTQGCTSSRRVRRLGRTSSAHAISVCGSRRMSKTSEPASKPVEPRSPSIASCCEAVHPAAWATSFAATAFGVCTWNVYGRSASSCVSGSGCNTPAVIWSQRGAAVGSTVAGAIAAASSSAPLSVFCSSYCTASVYQRPRAYGVAAGGTCGSWAQSVGHRALECIANLSCTKHGYNDVARHLDTDGQGLFRECQRHGLSTLDIADHCPRVLLHKRHFVQEAARLRQHRVQAMLAAGDGP